MDILYLLRQVVHVTIPRETSGIAVHPGRESYLIRHGNDRPSAPSSRTTQAQSVGRSKVKSRRASAILDLDRALLVPLSCIFTGRSVREGEVK